MKERLIGACILVALAVIFIPMFFEAPPPGATVTEDVDLPAAATSVQTFQMSLTRNTPPEPISPLVAAGKAPGDARSGRIDRAVASPVADSPTATPATANPVAEATPEPSTVKTVPVELLAPQPSQEVASETPDATTDTAAAGHTTTQLSGWFVQAGSFANRDNAERLTRRLKGKNFNAFMLPATSGGRKVYRVRIGPLDARHQAERLAPTVAAASGAPTEVVSNP